MCTMVQAVGEYQLGMTFRTLGNIICIKTLCCVKSRGSRGSLSLLGSTLRNPMSVQCFLCVLMKHVRSQTSDKATCRFSGLNVCLVDEATTVRNSCFGHVDLRQGI